MIENTTFVGLVAAACADPAANTPRLCLADWLDDHDHTTADPEATRAWAAYIRWDCGGRKGVEPDGLLRVIELGGWFGVDSKSPGAELNLSRGFPSHIKMGWLMWQSFGERLSWHPDEFEKSGRACPPTACPGVTVTIRGTLAITEGEAEYIEVLAYLRRRWPGVKAWHLPDVPRTIEDYQQDLINQLIRSAGISAAMLEQTTANYASTAATMRIFNERMYGSPVLEPRAFPNPDAE